MSDLKKLQQYIAKDRLYQAFFVATGDITLKKLEPKIRALGIAAEDIDIDTGRTPQSRRRKTALCVAISP